MTYFILQADTGAGVSHSQCRKKLGEALEKMQVNGLEGRNKQGKKCSVWYVWLNTDLLQTLKGEHLSSVFSPDGT